MQGSLPVPDGRSCMAKLSLAYSYSLSIYAMEERRDELRYRPVNAPLWWLVLLKLSFAPEPHAHAAHSPQTIPHCQKLERDVNLSRNQLQRQGSLR